MIASIIRQLLTESDNVTHDLYRYIALGAVLTFLGLQIYSVVWEKRFDAQAFGIGIGSTLAGVGLALGMKKDKPCPPAKDE